MAHTRVNVRSTAIQITYPSAAFPAPPTYSATTGPATSAAGEPRSETGTAFFTSRMHLILPSRGQPRGGLIVCHGQGKNADDALYGLGPGYLDYLADEGGYAIAVPDFGRRSWGNALAMTVADDAYTYVTTSVLGQPGAPVGMLTASMGAMTALNWAVRNKPKVFGLYLLAAAVDVQTIHQTVGWVTPWTVATGDPNYALFSGAPDLTNRNILDAAYLVADPLYLAGPSPYDTVAWGARRDQGWFDASQIPTRWADLNIRVASAELDPSVPYQMHEWWAGAVASATVKHRQPLVTYAGAVHQAQTWGTLAPNGSPSGYSDDEIQSRGGLPRRVLRDFFVTSQGTYVEPPPDPGDPDVYDIPVTIVDDGTMNQTGAIEAWLDTIPQGTQAAPKTARFGVNKDYRVDLTILQTDRVGLVIDGRGSRLFSTITTPIGPGDPKITRPILKFDSCTDITIKNITLQGTNTMPKFEVEREGQPAIQLWSVNRVLVTNVTAIGTWGDFVHLAPHDRGVASSRPMARNVEITGCDVTNSGRNWVSFTGCADINVHHNTFNGVGYQGFDFEVQHDTWHCRRVKVNDNTIDGQIHLSFVVCAGSGADVTDIEIERNTMLNTVVIDSCQRSIDILDTPPTVKANWRFRNNVIRCFEGAARINGVTDFVFEDNDVTQVPGGGCFAQTEIRVAVMSGPLPSPGAVIRNNRFRTGYDVVVGAATNITGQICSNRIDDLGVAYNRPIVCGASTGLVTAAVGAVV